MQIREMFAKSIDRDLQGVIIVGQDETANVKQELEEYVVTRELQKHFSDFFASYKNYRKHIKDRSMDFWFLWKW